MFWPSRPTVIAACVGERLNAETSCLYSVGQCCLYHKLFNFICFTIICIGSYCDMIDMYLIEFVMPCIFRAICEVKN